MKVTTINSIARIRGSKRCVHDAPSFDRLAGQDLVEPDRCDQPGVVRWP